MKAVLNSGTWHPMHWVVRSNMGWANSGSCVPTWGGLGTSVQRVCQVGARARVPGAMV